MKIFGLTGLKRFLVTALLGIGLVLLIAPSTIAAPFPQALIAQTTEAKPSESPQPRSSQPLTEAVEKTANPEQATTEQPATQDDQQRPAREVAPRERSQGDRTSTQAPYDPYDMNAIRQFDNSWYGQ